MLGRTTSGFTLLEALMVMAVGTIATAMAIPQFMGAMKNYRLTAAVASATGAIETTRYQAIMHGYPYQLTFNSTSGTFQVASKPSAAVNFSAVGGAIPISGMAEETLSPTTVLQFNSNGTVVAGAGNTLTFTITNGVKTETLTVSGVGNVSVTP